MTFHQCNMQLVKPNPNLFAWQRRTDIFSCNTFSSQPEEGIFGAITWSSPKDSVLALDLPCTDLYVGCHLLVRDSNPLFEWSETPWNPSQSIQRFGTFASQQNMFRSSEYKLRGRSCCFLCVRVWWVCRIVQGALCDLPNWSLGLEIIWNCDAE